MTTDYHQTLMDEAYGVWQSNKDMRYVDFVDSLGGGKHAFAVLTGNLNYQVENGGFSQWNLNGYSRKADELIRLLTKFNENEVIKEVCDIVEEAVEIMESYDADIAEAENYEYEDEDVDTYYEIECLERERNGQLDKLDTKYYAINEKFMKAINELLISL